MCYQIGKKPITHSSSTIVYQCSTECTAIQSEEFFFYLFFLVSFVLVFTFGRDVFISICLVRVYVSLYYFFFLLVNLDVILFVITIETSKYLTLNLLHIKLLVMLFHAWQFIWIWFKCCTRCCSSYGLQN